MEAGQAAPLSPGIRVILLFLLTAGAAMTAPPTYGAVGDPVTLKLPNCQVQDTFSVRWKKDNKEIGSTKMLSNIKASECQNCDLNRDGSLTLHNTTAGETTYSADVFDSSGSSQCRSPLTIKLVGQEKVVKPNIEFKCKLQKSASVSCTVSQGTEPQLILKMKDKDLDSVKRNVLNRTLSLENQLTIITCLASNQVSNETATVEINCEAESPPPWYLILAGVAGGVALIIFIILIIYSVRSCKRSGHTEEEELQYGNQPRLDNQHRQLPRPPGQPSAQFQSVATTCELEYATTKKSPPHHRQGVPEATPGGRKRRPPAPQIPTSPPPQNAALPVDQPTIPSLPGNHPADRQPLPQPRTKSKQPRQHRKSQQKRAT